MKEPPHFSNAPITEAIISINVEPADNISLKKLEKVNLGASYPNKQERIESKVTLEHTADRQNTSTTSDTRGYFFLSEDKKNVYQSCKGLYAFSRLKPYDSWQPFQSEAQRIWNIYRETVEPENISRLAVRFINKVEVPLPCPDISRYFNFYPESPDSIEQMVKIFIKCVSRLNDIDAFASLTLARIESESVNSAAFILDIEVYRDDNIPQSEEEIWALFNKFRDKKNQIFLESFKEDYLQEFK